jgi:hypothetical protein
MVLPASKWCSQHDSKGHCCHHHGGNLMLPPH